MKKVDELREEAFMIMSNIALFADIYNGTMALSVIDLKNLKNKAKLVYRKEIQGFSILDSTFPEGKRKYEMLYLVERNKKLVCRSLKKELLKRKV